MHVLKPGVVHLKCEGRRPWFALVRAREGSTGGKALLLMGLTPS